MMSKFAPAGLVAALALSACGAAWASPINVAPPTGAILDLNGLTLPGATPTTYTMDFAAGVANTGLTFAFRYDLGFLYMNDVSLVNLTTSSGNLVSNGNFSGGVYTDNGNGATPNDWTYTNPDGATIGGQVVTFSLCPGGGLCWSDGAVQAYDFLSQTIPTVIGDNYEISFVLASQGLSGNTFSRVCTDTGCDNGIDVLVYASGATTRAPVPEPTPWLLLVTGLLGLGTFWHRHRTEQG